MLCNLATSCKLENISQRAINKLRCDLYVFLFFSNWCVINSPDQCSLHVLIMLRGMQVMRNGKKKKKIETANCLLNLALTRPNIKLSSLCNHPQHDCCIQLPVSSASCQLATWPVVATDRQTPLFITLQTPRNVNAIEPFTHKECGPKSGTCCC